MKKGLSLVLVLCLCLSLAACAKNEPPASAPTEELSTAWGALPFGLTLHMKLSDISSVHSGLPTPTETDSGGYATDTIEISEAEFAAEIAPFLGLSQESADSARFARHRFGSNSGTIIQFYHLSVHYGSQSEADRACTEAFDTLLADLGEPLFFRNDFISWFTPGHFVTLSMRSYGSTWEVVLEKHS